MSDSESNKTEKKKVSPEFVENVKRYLAVDDKLRDIREKSKVLNNEKKEREEFILKYLQTIEEEEIGVIDGKLKRNVTKSQAPLKKEFIQKALVEIVGDATKAQIFTEHILKSRPVTEKVTLRRSKNRVKEAINNLEK
jgi:hypothetical protein